MRPVPEALRARLASGVTTLVHAWRIARRDGVTFGFTDHDRDLAFDAVTYRAATGLAAGEMEKGLGLGADSAGASGVLSDEVIDDSDLIAGLWDGARVDAWRVDWTDTALRVHLFAGRIGEVRRGPAAFVAELRGLQAAFDAPFGRVFSRFCDADVGDTRCGVDLTAPAFRGEGVVAALDGARGFKATGLGAFADGWFARGMVTWADNTRSEVAAHRVSAAHGALELAESTPAMVVGATFVIAAGCDKRFVTCRAKFANTVNFRGFPHMPGNDAVVAGADPGQPFDGGSRYGL